MTVCALCGCQSLDAEICYYHAQGIEDDWSAVNRVMCDFLHRGVIPARVRTGPDDLAEILAGTF